MQIVWWLLGFYFWLSFNQPLTTICEKIKTLASLVSEISPQLLPYITHVIKFNKFAKKVLNYFRIHQNSQKHKDYNITLIYHLHIITVTTRTLFFATSTIINFHLKSSRDDDYNNNNNFSIDNFYMSCAGLIVPNCNKINIGSSYL